MSDRPYVDLLEAVRIVVRLMPDGHALASKITNEWIKEGLGRFDAPEDDPDDYMVRAYGQDWPSRPDWESARRRVIASYEAAAEGMVRLYGDDWREMRPRVIAAFGKAVGLLHELLRTGRIHGVGVSDAMPKSERREIELHEWSSLQLNIGHGILEAAHHPAIRAVLINREQLLTGATLRLAPPRVGSHRHKREATDAAINTIGAAVLTRMSQKELEAAILKQVADHNNGLEVSGRYARQRLSKAQKR